MLYSGNEENVKHEINVNNKIGKVKVSSGEKVGFWAIMIVGVIPLGCSIFWLISKKNSLNRMQIKINEAASNIDVQLQKRFDTLVKLVDSVKNQIKFNKEIFTEIAAIRSNNNSYNLQDKSKSIDTLSKSINFCMEAYPNLGADDSISKLMNEITMIEREISASRRLYNANVTSFNELIFSFPISVIAAKRNYEAIPLFAVDDEVKKDVKINF